MKINVSHIFASLLLIQLCGCSDNYDPYWDVYPDTKTHYLHVSKTNFYTGTPLEHSEKFYVDSYDTKWTFNNTESWYQLSPKQGSTSKEVTLNVEENNSADSERTSIFYFKSEDKEWQYSKAMSVSQDKAIPTVTLQESDINCGGATQEITVDVSSNCSWFSSCTASWVKLRDDVDSGILYISVEDNLDTSYRTAYIYIYYGGGNQKTLKLTQDIAAIKGTIYELDAEDPSSKFNVVIESEVPWKSSVSDSWIQISPTSGNAGKTTTTIETAPNTSTSDRTGYVSFITGNKVRLQVEIRQRGIFLKATESLQFTSVSESKSINIESNDSWEIMNCPNWLELSEASGSGDAEIIVTSKDNPNTSSREGEIVIGHPGLDLEATVQVYQAGKILEPDVQVIEFSDKSETRSFHINSDAQWTSTKSADWFDVSPMDGTGPTDISVTVSENTTPDERAGTIMYNYVDMTKNVNIHQLAKYLTIDNASFNFDSKGGTHEVELLTNDEWTATVAHDVDWLELSKTSGNGNENIVITAKDNPSVNVRSTEVFIETANSQSVRILVSQKPRYLTVSSKSLIFFAEGGTSDIFRISTDGEYEITGNSSWFTINKGEGDTFTVYSAKNTSNEFRRGEIEITLTDLEEGTLSLTISVLQAGVGGSFIANPYPGDTLWDEIIDGDLSITINGYTTDRNWDSSWGSLLKVNVTGFSSDQDWNLNDKSNCRATVTLYGSDNDWNSSFPSTGNLNGNGYSGDGNWNNGSGTGNINGNDYSGDGNWNNGSGSGNVNGNGYSGDGNWNNASGSGNINGNGYSGDENWNNSSGSGNINGNGYSGDENWNNNSSSSGEINSNEYEDDNNWNN